MISMCLFSSYRPWSERLVVIPSFTASKVVVRGDFLTPAYKSEIMRSLIGTTSPAPTVGPYLERNGTL